MTIEALTAQEENAEADRLLGSLQQGSGGVMTTRMCYMCFDDVDEASNPLVSCYQVSKRSSSDVSWTLVDLSIILCKTLTSCVVPCGGFTLHDGGCALL